MVFMNNSIKILKSMLNLFVWSSWQFEKGVVGEDIDVSTTAIKDQLSSEK